MEKLNTSYLKNIVLLVTSESRISTLNITPLPLLEVLIASDSPLEDLIIQCHSGLHVLQIENTMIDYLDAKVIPNITSLFVGGSHIISLDLRANSMLDKLYCSDIQQI